MSSNVSGEAGNENVTEREIKRAPLYRKNEALRGRSMWIPPAVLNTEALFSVCFSVRSHFSPRSVSKTRSLIQKSEEHSSLTKGPD